MSGGMVCTVTRSGLIAILSCSSDSFSGTTTTGTTLQITAAVPASATMAANVDWLQAGINSGAVLVLIILWIHIKRMARELAEAFQEEINRRESHARNNAVAV